MMKKILLTSLVAIFSQLLFGQNRNSIWCFGDSAGIDFTNLANPIPFFSGMDERGSCSSIADTSGNLQFYCFSSITSIDSASFVFNSLNVPMSNGNRLIGSALYNQVTIIPMPEDSKKFYVFHEGFYNAIGLYFSIVDLSLNGGLGAVVQKNIQLNTYLPGDCLQAVRHGNGRDWWLIAKLGGNGATQINRFFIYKISPGAIDPPIIQDFGNAFDAVFQKLTFNHDATKLMNVNVGGYMEEFNFDRCTGIISNSQLIFPQQTMNFNRYFVEGAYSPNDSLFYVSTWWYSFPNDTSRLLQYNLFAPNIPTSCDTLFEQRNPNIFGAVRLGPDNKIYLASFYNWGFPGFPYPDSVRNSYNENLSVINNPNIDGVLCNFQPFSFYLGGKRSYGGLPNNPNYQLGPLIGSPCDTLNVGIEELQEKNQAELFVFYHSQWQTAFINAQKLKGKKYTLAVYDLLGKEIFKENGKLSSTYYTKDLSFSTFAKGMYIVSLTTEHELMSKKFIVE